jgi:hypothetical protein
MTWIGRAAWRLGGSLLAFPLQVIALVIVTAGAGEAVGPLYRRLLGGVATPARLGPALFGGLVLGVPVAMLLSTTAAIMVGTLGRAVYYPFWAFGARPAELAHSWGGPTPAGATLVHWLVVALILVAGDLVLRVGGLVQRHLLFGRARVRPRRPGRRGSAGAGPRP